MAQIIAFPVARAARLARWAIRTGRQQRVWEAAVAVAGRTRPGFVAGGALWHQAVPVVAMPDGTALLCTTGFRAWVQHYPALAAAEADAGDFLGLTA